MKLDSRLYFINDPFLYIPLFIVLALLGFVIKQEQPKTPQVKKEAVKSDTTECRENKGRFLYNTK